MICQARHRDGITEMKFTLKEKLALLAFVVEELESGDPLTEAKKSKLTPYQKALRNRRQTVAAHTPRPAKQSVFYKHAVRAIFNKLRKDGESFRGAAKGGQLIAQWMLKKHGYAAGKQVDGVDTGDFKLTGKGHRQNKKHTAEPASKKKRKGAAYDRILGVQRRKATRQQQVKHKSLGAG
jgi:hypothetical protein